MDKEILYIADPMCSWCWGFSPVITNVRDDFSDHAIITPVMGGLRPGNDQVINEEAKKVLLHHWHQVHESTSQPFDFDLKFPDDFVLDTEPSCRAVVTMHHLKPEAPFDYLKALQQAFYLDHRNLTQIEVLIELAVPLDVDTDAFAKHFESGDMKNRTVEGFHFSHRLGVQGFPTVILNDREGFKLLCNGYQPYERLKPFLQAWVDGSLQIQSA